MSYQNRQNPGRSPSKIPASFVIIIIVCVVVLPMIFMSDEHPAQAQEGASTAAASSETSTEAGPGGLLGSGGSNTAYKLAGTLDDALARQAVGTWYLSDMLLSTPWLGSQPADAQNSAAETGLSLLFSWGMRIRLTINDDGTFVAQTLISSRLAKFLDMPEADIEAANGGPVLYSEVPGNWDSDGQALELVTENTGMYGAIGSDQQLVISQQDNNGNLLFSRVDSAVTQEFEENPQGFAYTWSLINYKDETAELTEEILDLLAAAGQKQVFTLTIDENNGVIWSYGSEPGGIQSFVGTLKPVDATHAMLDLHDGIEYQVTLVDGRLQLVYDDPELGHSEANFGALTEDSLSSAAKAAAQKTYLDNPQGFAYDWSLVNYKDQSYELTEDMIKQLAATGQEMVFTLTIKEDNSAIFTLGNVTEGIDTQLGTLEPVDSTHATLDLHDGIEYKASLVDGELHLTYQTPEEGVVEAVLRALDTTGSQASGAASGTASTAASSSSNSSSSTLDSADAGADQDIPEDPRERALYLSGRTDLFILASSGQGA